MTYSVCHALLESKVRLHHISVTYLRPYAHTTILLSIKSRKHFFNGLIQILRRVVIVAEFINDHDQMSISYAMELYMS